MKNVLRPAALWLVLVLSAGTSAEATVTFDTVVPGRSPSGFLTPIGPIIADISATDAPGPEIITADFSGSSLFISKGTAAGGSAGNVTLPGPNQPYTMAAADLNGPGFGDDLLFSVGGKVRYYLHDGAGSYGAFIDLESPALFPSSIGTGDFNGDGWPDIVASGDGPADFAGNSGFVEIYLSTTDVNGLFTGFGAAQAFSTDKSGGRVAVGDLNGDNFPDVAVNSTAPNGNPAVCVFFGDPTGALNGTPLLINKQVVGTSDHHPVGIAIGDLTLDGKPEIVTSSYSLDAGAGTVTSWVDVLVANAAGQFSSSQGFLITPAAAGTSGPGSGVALADLDGDFKVDIATVNYLDPTLHVLRLTAVTGGGFSIDGHDTIGIPDSPHLLTLGDLNSDHLPDVVIAHADANGLTTRLNTSSGPVNSGKAIYFALPAYNEVEGDTVPVTVYRGSESTGAVSVEFTVGGTATPSGFPNSDFNVSSPTNRRLDFQAGEYEETIFISLSGEAGGEPEETVVLTLQPPVGDAELGTPATTTITIHDSESPGGTVAAANGLVVKPGNIVPTKGPALKALGVKAVARNSSRWEFAAVQSKDAKKNPFLEVEATTSDPATNPQWTRITALEKKTPKGTTWVGDDYVVPVGDKVWFRTMTILSGVARTAGQPVGPYKIIPGPRLELLPVSFTDLRNPADFVHPGEAITYRFRYRNIGDGPATNVVLSAPIPGFTRYEVHTRGRSSDVKLTTAKRGSETVPIAIKWTFASIAPGADDDVDLVVSVFTASDFNSNNPNAAYGRTINQHAYFLTAPDQGIERENGVPLEMKSVVNSPLELTVEPDGNVVDPGQIITYTLTATNHSGATLPGGIITNRIPSGTILDQVFFGDANGDSTNTAVPNPTTASNPAVDSSGLITWNLGTIAPNSTRTLKFTVRVIYDLPTFTVDKKGVSHTTEVVNEEYDFTAGPNDARVFTFGRSPQPPVRSVVSAEEPESPPRLGLSKRAIGDRGLNEAGENGNGTVKYGGVGDVTNVLQNGSMDYELLFFNSGEATAPKAVLHDVIPPGLILRGFFTRTSSPTSPPVGLNANEIIFYNAGGKPMVATADNIDQARSFDIKLGNMSPGTAGVIRYTVAATAKPGTVIHSFGGFDPKSGLSAKLQGFFISTPVMLNDVGGTPDDLISRVAADVTFSIDYQKLAFEAKPGVEIPFDITYEQNGDVSASNTKITVGIPQGTTPILSGAHAPSIVDGEPIANPTFSGGVLQLSLGTVPAHSGGTVRIHVLVNTPLDPALAATDAVVLPFPQISGNYIKGAPASPFAIQAFEAGSPAQQTATAISNTVDPVPIVEGTAPKLFVGRVAPISVIKGEFITYSIFFGNFGDSTATNVNLGMQVPFGTQFISATNGTLAVPNGTGTTQVQNPTAFTTTPRSARQARDAGGTGPDIVSWHIGNLLAGHAAGTVELTVQVSPKFDECAVEDHSVYINADNAASKVPGAFSTQVRSGNFAAAAWESIGCFFSGIGAAVSSGNRVHSDAIVRDLNVNSRLIMTGGTDTLPLTNGVLVINMLNQRALAVGGEIISGGAGNIISNDGASIISGGAGNIISGGAGNAISITNIAAGFGTKDCAYILSNVPSIISGGAGNLIAAGGGNIISNDGASLIGQDGAGLGNILRQNASIISGGGGNIISGGGGNVLSTGQSLIGQDGAGLIGNDGGGIISGGGGNVTATSAGNIISNDGASFAAKNAAAIISGGAGN